MVARDLAEEEGGVLLHLDSGQYHGVNRTGLAIWNAIEDGCTAREVIERVAAGVESPPSSLEGDVLAFLASIHERDLIAVDP